MNSIIIRPDIPYYGNVPSNFSSGKEVNVDGIIPSTGLRFSIGLQCNYENQTDIALEIIVDLFDNILSINSKQNNTWDEIQTISISNVFIPSDRKFKFTIQYNSQLYYKILINDREVVDYPQKVSYQLVSHLVICGEIQVLQISYTSSEPYSNAPLTPITPPPSYSEVISGGNRSAAANLSSVTDSNYIPEIQGEQYGYGYGSVSSRDYDLQQTSISSLNAASSNFRPVKSSNRKKCVSYIVIIFFIVIILLASYAGRKEKTSTPRYTMDRESVWK